MATKQSQITTEFLIIICFIFVISLSFISAAGIQMKGFSDNNKKELIEDFGESLKKEIRIASTVRNGYERKITLPEKIDSSIDYSITMKNSTLIIYTEEYEFVTIIPKTIGNLSNGSNTIRKINGSVYIENV